MSAHCHTLTKKKQKKNVLIFATVFALIIEFDLYLTRLVSWDLKSSDQNWNVYFCACFCVCVCVPVWRSCSDVSGGSWTAGTYWPRRKNRRTWCCCWLHKLHNWRVRKQVLKLFAGIHRKGFRYLHTHTHTRSHVKKSVHKRSRS